MATTKADLVDRVSRSVGASITKRDCALVVDALVAELAGAVQGGETVELRGFGTFKTVLRSPRVARNPRTGQPIRLEARNVPQFRPSKSFQSGIRG
jgi:nucleoid DNA-binding protein